MLFNFFQLSAQEDNKSYCGTIPVEDAYLQDPFYGNSEALLKILREVGYDMPDDYLNNLDTYGNYIGKDKEYGNKASVPILREIPIKAWIYRNDNGSGNYSISAIYQMVEVLNQLFSNNTNIRFYLLCDITEINDSSITNNGNAYFTYICGANKVAGAINAHFIIEANSSWSGRANSPDDTPNLRYSLAAEMTGNNSRMAGLLAHEIGHTLGLHHTHKAGRSWSHSNNGGCGDCHQESVSRTRRQKIGCVGTYDKLKCDVNGDFLCDTAADPELENNLVDFNTCIYNSANGGTDNWEKYGLPTLQTL